MRPDDTRPTTPIVVPPRESNLSTSGRSVHAEEAANVVRNQIDTLYDKTAAERAAQQAAATPVEENVQYSHQQQNAANPYQRTHNEQQHQIETNAWQKYHTAWQSYYQQYYERYYVSQVHEAKKSLESQGTNQPAPEMPITTDEAMYDLRSKLRLQVEERATKVRKSRHFMPTMAAVAVLLVFLFLQYNRVLFATVEAYVTPGNMDPSSLIVDPATQGAVGPDPRLIIPKINVDVPIIWDAVAADQNSLNAAMDKGVAWFNIPGANAKPGERGNFALSGHSSNDWLDKGDYKFIFARLEQMKVGDVIYVNYDSVRYTYNITKTVVVKPTDVSALTNPTDKPEITLITCTPLGTALNRLLVFAEQVSPDPNAATAVSTVSTGTGATKMPSNSPTFIQRLFGGN
jgi:sortase A